MFSTPELWLWDSLRVLSCALAVVVVPMVMFSVRKPRMLWHQQLRMLCEAGFCVAVTGAYLSTLGQLPDQPWRNLLVFLLMVGLAVGHCAFLLQYRARSR